MLCECIILVIHSEEGGVQSQLRISTIVKTMNTKIGENETSMSDSSLERQNFIVPKEKYHVIVKMETWLKQLFQTILTSILSAK